MKKAIERCRVSGFLHASGRELHNDREEPVLLLGWGLGNWLLCEGYMWGFDQSPMFDRPQRIEHTLRTLTGDKYAERFWKSFRSHYITDADLALMAEMGCNSLRIPISSRLFLEDGPRLKFRTEGFHLLDRVLDGCEKYGLYAFIDLHAAPGGQTGANIDDSMDDLCRLFIDEAQFERGLALWEEIARRYHDRWIVGGYDLLNEPIRPVRFQGDPDLDGYEPRLRAFYEQAIERIRRYDQKHLIALEGIHWATDTGIFDHVYDDNMVIHFHRYGCPPDISSLREYLEVSERLNLPLWLGETGENTMAWFSAMIPLAFRYGISVTMWPWKKNSCDNSPCSYPEPAHWHLLRNYLSGGAQPSYEQAQQLFNELLQNIRVENCRINTGIQAQLLRIPGCEIQGTDFDDFPGTEAGCHPETPHPDSCYRFGTGMDIIQETVSPDKSFPFDGPWRTALLQLHENEWAQYSVYDVSSSCHLEIECLSNAPSRLEITQDHQSLGMFDLSGYSGIQLLSGMNLYTASRCTLRLTVRSGSVCIRRLLIRPAG